MSEPIITVAMTEKWVWDCSNPQNAFYETKHNVLTAIDNKINWCMDEIEQLRSLGILTIEDLQRCAKEMKYLQITVSDCMISFFRDLETFIDMKFDINPDKQMAVEWTGDKFVQGLFYDIFEKLHLDYSLDIARDIMFIKPKFHKIRDYDMNKSFIK